MISSGNKILYVVASHDCGKFIVINSLKNNPDIFYSDYIGSLFKKYHNDLTKVLDIIDKDKELIELSDSIPINSDSYKYVLLVSWNPIHRVLKKIEGVIPVFLFRDVRVSWLVSEHKKEGGKEFYNIGIEDYVQNFNNLLQIYLNIIKKQKALVFKFEDFLVNKRSTYNSLCNQLDIRYDPKDIPEFFRGKTNMLSMFDIEKIVKFQKYVDNEQLSYISSKTKEYNKLFNYPHYLSKEEILQGLKT